MMKEGCMALSVPTFGELLRQLRRRVGLTQGELALVVGFSVAQISRLEKDERLPDLAMLVEKFLPALALDDEPRLAQRLLELAAIARGERLPTAIIAQREVRTIVQEEIVESDSSLPTLPVPLLGREQDLAAINKRLMEAPGRLLTLIGPPGVGKTQLALAVAGKLYHLFGDGVHFVPLAAVTEPDHVPSAILTGLGLADIERKLPRNRLFEHLRRKNLLLVLDNFEQLSAAAPLVADLLAECAGLRILVTSQEPLRLRAEQRQRVLPLVLAAAVELFFQRAQAIDADFATDAAQAAVVAVICLRLDCLPLAIELMAAQSEFFAPAQLLTRLEDQGLDLLADGPRDLPAHQRTLRNAIHRSYMLLAEPEQRLFRTLGVFAGGCTPAALAAVLDPQAMTTPDAKSTTQLLISLRTLARKSLVQQQITSVLVHEQTVMNKASSHEQTVSNKPPSSEQTAATKTEQERFLLLTTLGAYAVELLVAIGEEERCRRNHAHYFLFLAQTAEQAMRGKAKKVWLDQLEVEHENLRGALTWSLVSDPPMALHLANALTEFWATRGHDYEARRWIDLALAANAHATPPRAAALVAAANFARRQADYTLGQTYIAEGIAIYQTYADPAGLARALREDGWLEYDLHYKANTIERFYASLALYRTVGDKEGIAHVLLCLVHVMNGQPEYHTQLQAYLAESLALLRELDQPEDVVRALQQQGELALSLGNYAAAEAHFREALVYWRQVNSRLNIAWSVALVGEAAALQDDLGTAELCYAEAYQIFTELGNKDGCANVRYHMAEVARRQGRAAEARQLYRESIDLCWALQNRHVAARCLAGMGSMDLMLGNTIVGATLLCAAQTIFSGLPPFLPPADQQAFTASLAAARQALDETTFAQCLRAGQVSTLDDVVALVELADARMVE